MRSTEAGAVPLSVVTVGQMPITLSHIAAAAEAEHAHWFRLGYKAR